MSDVKHETPAWWSRPWVPYLVLVPLGFAVGFALAEVFP